MDATLFRTVLATGHPVPLDGGLATQLEAQGADLSDRLWSARLLIEEPEAITAAHVAFYRAGARVATTASYQATFEGFAARGIDRDSAEVLLRRSVVLAVEARARHLMELEGRGLS
ncbi:MAG: homocysteine S-methyltransferase family protein, partial [Chloroflexi bacterium]|nr:homocysteine S-methyltransferase family protein [Chloroflexota bacterium]